jgi:hypothetical protein
MPPPAGRPHERCRRQPDARVSDATASPAERRAQVLAFVRERDFVTFAALHQHFAGAARDSTEISLPGNRVIWAGLPKPWIPPQEPHPVPHWFPVLLRPMENVLAEQDPAAGPAEVSPAAGSPPPKK